MSPTSVLGEPFPARLIRALVELRRAATTAELAEMVGAHPNTVRRHLQRLSEVGAVQRRRTRAGRGRPRDEWALSSGAGGDAYSDLARWLARALRSSGDIEHTGREIGRELAPRGGGVTALQDAFAALGFAPRPEHTSAARMRFVLENCPYREAVLENQPVVCGLHRGISEGLLDRIDPTAELARFVPRDPYAAGCVVEVSSRRARSASASSGSASSTAKSSRSSKRT